MDYAKLTALNPVVESDTGTWGAISGPDREETTAMVYVGDVYALVAADGADEPDEGSRHDTLWPLIR